jgi:DNA polymerase-1
VSDPTYLVIDTETTRKSPIGHDATPFWDENKVVMVGWRCGHWADPTEVHTSKYCTNFTQPGFKLVVGHNLTFDIHHMLKAGGLSKEFLGTVSLWDTQLAEYLLTGQRTHYASLDDLAKKYGGTLKDDTVKKAFEAGAGADEIDEDVLREYLKGDVLNTERVFIEQFKLAQEMGLLPLIQTQMDALLGTIEMTYNGLAVDGVELMKGYHRVSTEVAALDKKLKAIAAVFGPHHADFNPGSTKQVSTLLFGGTIKEVVMVCVGTYKNGKPKYKREDRETFVPGMAIGPTGEKNGKGDYPTDDAALQEVLSRMSPHSTMSRDFIETLMEYRDKNKQLGTYWEGMSKLVMPDGCIHHKLNHTVTRTGRLSSSDPNLQNVTNGDIKKVFVSRWGEDGVIVEADYSQLEMIELAILSNDPQLQHDILTGTDMHNALFEAMYRRRMRPEERKKFKRCSFALVYGAGPGGIAAQGGISKEDAKKFIDTFYSRYEGVRSYHQSILAEAAIKREYHGLKDAATGLPMGEFTYTSEYTKRRYWFKEYPTDWGTINFSPTELKNYMVQGGATGDKVPLAVGMLFRVLRNHDTLKDKCLLINTVHDSVMFDVQKNALTHALLVIKQTMESVPEEYERVFGYKMPLPLKVGVSIGPNWLDQKEIEFTYSHAWRLAA